MVGKVFLSGDACYVAITRIKLLEVLINLRQLGKKFPIQFGNDKIK